MDKKEKLSIEEIKANLLNDINFFEDDFGLPNELEKKFEEDLKEIDKLEKEKSSLNNEMQNNELPKLQEARPEKKDEPVVAINSKVVATSQDTTKEETKKINNTKTKIEVSKIDKGFKNSYIYGFIFIVASILLEVANFVRLGLGFLPTCFGIEFAILLMIAGFIFLVPTEPLKITVMSIFFGVQLLMNIANASLYKVMYELVTVDMIFTLGFETVDAFDFAHLDMTAIICALIVLVIYIAMIIIGRKVMPKYKIRKTRTAIVSLLILIFCVEILGFSSLKMFEVGYFAGAEQNVYVDNNKFLYENTTSAKFASLKKYGFWSFYIHNASNFFNYNSTLSDEEYSNLNEYITNSSNFKYSYSDYNNVNVSGALSGDNLIVIMLESVEWFAIDPYNTPRLYEFIEDYCVKFTNFYGRNKTNISEQVSMLGNYVSDSSLVTINNNVGLNVPNSLPNLFKADGYESVNFFHDYDGKVYSRNIVNKAIGFDNVYAEEQCPIDNKSQYLGDFLDDGDFVEAYKELFMPRDKSFFSYYTTVTTHGPYDKTNERYTEYYNLFESNYSNYCKYVQDNNLGYATPNVGSNEYQILKEYKARAMAVDNAINVILNYLKTTRDGNNLPLYDNTTILMFADHNAYYSELGYKVKNIDKYENNKEIYNIPFTIFNKSLQAGEVDTFCNTFDIYPTICDLYGLEFNNGLTQGYSVFSEQIEGSLMVSMMAGIFDDDYFTVTLDDYTAQNNSLDTNAKLAGFKQKINNFYEKQQYIEAYYRINYEEYNRSK